MNKKLKHPANKHDRMVIEEKKVIGKKKQTRASPKRLVKEEIYDKETQDELQKARFGDLLIDS